MVQERPLSEGGGQVILKVIRLTDDGHRVGMTGELAGFSQKELLAAGCVNRLADLHDRWLPIAGGR